MLLWEKLGVLNSLLMWEHLAGSGVYGKIVSPAYLIVGFLSFAWCIGVTQLVLGFFFFFEGNCSVCNCRSSVSTHILRDTRRDAQRQAD